jgi:hypothetical protein
MVHLHLTAFNTIPGQCPRRIREAQEEAHVEEVHITPLRWDLLAQLRSMAIQQRLGDLKLLEANQL